eukprot:Sspe_Gene.56953::Locus_31278_Transcript_1_1_Confidence_1.000_Length_1434::g.56953::m.56953
MAPNPCEGRPVRLQGSTEVMEWICRHGWGAEADGKVDTEEFKDLVEKRKGSVNLVSENGMTALHLACQELHPAISPEQQEDLLTTLVHAGGCLYIADKRGLTPLTQLTGTHMERIVRSVLKIRMEIDREVPSAAPLSASRMIRGGKAGGVAQFSKVCEHLLFYLNDGGILAWDTKQDEEYQVYVPGDEFPELGILRTKLQDVKSQREIAEYNHSKMVDEYMQQEISLQERMEALEARVPKVVSFYNFAVPRTRIQGGSSGIEWILCDNGSLIEVEVTEDGMKLERHQGANTGEELGPLRKVHTSYRYRSCSLGSTMSRESVQLSIEPQPGSKRKTTERQVAEPPIHMLLEKEAGAAFRPAAAKRTDDSTESTPFQTRVRASVDFSFPPSPGRQGKGLVTPVESVVSFPQQPIPRSLQKRRASAMMNRKDTAMSYKVGPRPHNAGCLVDTMLGIVMLCRVSHSQLK